MTRTKELFAQKEMRISNRFKKSREDLLRDSINLGDNPLENLLSQWENEKKEKSRIRKELIKAEKKRQIELFPEQREYSLWQNSIKQLSASKLSTYRGCAHAYRYNYLLHAKVPQSPSKIFGKEIHYMLQSFNKMNFKSSESFIKFWMHRWWGVVKGKYGDVEIAFKRKDQPGNLCGLGVNILRPFYEHNKKIKKPDMFEKDFKEYNLDFEGIKLIGKWDRVDEIDGKIIITDYKTDYLSPAKNTFLLHRHPQFTFYALAWYLKSKKKEIPHLLFHHLRTGKVFRTRRTEEDFEYLSDVIVKTKKRVQEGDFTPFYGFHCNGCDFMNSICEEHCVGVGSKLKKLEEEKKVEPEIDTMFSYDVPQLRIRGPDDEKYAQKGDFKNAYYSLKNYLNTAQCPIEAREGLFACMVWDDESPIRLPDPEIDN